MNHRKAKNQSFILSIVFASVCLLVAGLIKSAENMKTVSKLEISNSITAHSD